MTRAAGSLFFALWPSDAIRAALLAACRPALDTCGGRAVPAHQYHLTLAFLGADNRSADRVDRLATMASVAMPEFDLVLDHYGHWRRPGVLWLGPRRCPAGLVSLVAQIRAQLEALGISYDCRDFRPHLTLARKVTVLPELDAPVPVHWPVRGFVLVESAGTRAGPVYEVVRWFLPDGGSFPAGSRDDPKQA